MECPFLLLTESFKVGDFHLCEKRSPGIFFYIQKHHICPNKRTCSNKHTPPFFCESKLLVPTSCIAEFYGSIASYKNSQVGYKNEEFI